jgi:ribonucleoside-diphosphate reductase alpha chain
VSEILPSSLRSSEKTNGFSFLFSIILPIFAALFMKNSNNKHFRTDFSESIFTHKYKHDGAETWPELSKTLIEDVCGGILPQDEIDELIQYHTDMKFIAGGRYLYYAGRENKYFNNCFLLKALEDSREDWANISWKAESCLATGGGIGVDYSIYRPKGAPISKTGGVASGPVSKMRMVNEIGREVMQGGSRRSAIYASLNWLHPEADEFLHCKDWKHMPVAGAFGEDGKQLTIGDLKEADFNYPAPLDMTNISLNYDNKFLEAIYQLSIDEIENRINKGEELEVKYLPPIFVENVRQALMTGEPGFSFNFFSAENETLRNACTEVTSEDDSDVCNLASINMSRITSLEEMVRVTYLASRFLYCGTFKAKLPYDKVYEVREKNRRLGLGIMGVHEWLLTRGYRYEMNPELDEWLAVWRSASESGANKLADSMNEVRPIAYRAIAPTGSIGILACTSTGIEPLYAVAFKRRYLKNKKEWHYQYVIDGTAKTLINDFNVDPDGIETAVDLAKDPERRIKFQADIQKYVDMSISSTINMPEWGSEYNNESMVMDFAMTLAKYAHNIRGFTCYPDGSRGGQPLTPVPYTEAISLEGKEFKEQFHDICDITNKGGTCGV